MNFTGTYVLQCQNLQVENFQNIKNSQFRTMHHEKCLR